MKFETFVRTAIKRLNNIGFDYAITGAVAASHYGTPRTTTDLDVQIKATPRQHQKLLTALKKQGFNFDLNKAGAALKSGYNIITINDDVSPFSLDLIITSNEVERKPAKLLGINTFYQSAEQLILAKLRMIKSTRPPERSQKDREDIKSILEYTRVDLPKLRKLARNAKTIEVLEELMAGP